MPLKKVFPKEFEAVYSVLLVSSFRLAREAAKALIELHPDFKVVEEAAERSHVLRVLASLHPDVILFDLDPDYAAGIETIRGILKNAPHIKIVVLSMHDEDATVESALRAGVRGFISKAGRSVDLVEVLKTIVQGEAYLCPRIIARVIGWVRNRELKGAPNHALEGLSEREVQVLRLLADGQTSKEIACSLNLAVETVRTYRKTLMKKLQVNNVAGLIRFAASAGLIAIAEQHKSDKGGGSG